jgi:hypothetical protein
MSSLEQITRWQCCNFYAGKKQQIKSDNISVAASEEWPSIFPFTRVLQAGDFCVRTALPYG